MGRRTAKVTLSRRSFLALTLMLSPVVLGPKTYHQNRKWRFDPSLPFERLASNPIISPHMGDWGDNINGPSLIRVPDWVENPLGRYYLYFAHHEGTYIRLAYADDLAGPWTIHEPGSLHLEDIDLIDHVASPDVHVDYDRKQIRMYVHGIVPEDQLTPQLLKKDSLGGTQRTKVAISTDGLAFEGLPGILGAPYFRVFEWQGFFYALATAGIFYRSPNGLTDFERGPTIFGENMRHSAVFVSEDRLYVFFSRAGDAPERILLSSIDLTLDWYDWRKTTPVTVLEPEMDYEGGDLPVVPSQRGRIDGPVHQLRDPAVFQEDDQLYLLYSVAGEQGIAIARQVSEGA